MRLPAALRRVVVTGIGVVSPAGTGLEAFWTGLQTEAVPAQERRVEDFDPSPWLSGKQARHLDRFTHFAVAAAQMALDDAGGTPALDLTRAGVQLGTGIGGVGTLETQVGVLAARGPGRVSPFTIPMVMPNAGAATVSLRFGYQGPSETLTTACAAGTHSVAAGARMIADGRCDVVLAGGLRLAVERRVTRRRLVPRRGDADPRLVDVLVGEAHRAKERALRSTLGAVGDDRGLGSVHGCAGS